MADARREAAEAQQLLEARTASIVQHVAQTSGDALEREREGWRGQLLSLEGQLTALKASSEEKVESLMDERELVLRQLRGELRETQESAEAERHAQHAAISTQARARPP